ncbi:MAG: PEGA domain-containing protein [Candidatus Neomarinimicrobiota bacterium]
MVLPIVLVLAQTPTTITSDPSGAVVKINWRVIGTTPINNYLMSMGNNTITLEMDGYAPIVSQVKIHMARHLELGFELNQIHPVTFKSAVGGLRFATGKETWSERKIKLKMEAGIHQIDVFAGDVPVDSIRVTVNGPLKYIYDPR